LVGSLLFALAEHDALGNQMLLTRQYIATYWKKTSNWTWQLQHWEL
jgi:hypothetical protein